MKNLMMSLPKFLKVTPSSNLFAFRLQSTFKRYVYTKYFTTIYIGAELGGAAGARAPPLLHNPRKFII